MEKRKIVLLGLGLAGILFSFSVLFATAVFAAKSPETVNISTLISSTCYLYTPTLILLPLGCILLITSWFLSEKIGKERP